MSIFANLALPVDARIFVVLRVPADKVARKVVEAEAVQEVARAVQAWYYETYC